MNMTNISMENKIMIYFVDTGAFYAGKDPSDQHYTQAREVLEEV